MRGAELFYLVEINTPKQRTVRREEIVAADVALPGLGQDGERGSIVMIRRLEKERLRGRRDLKVRIHREERAKFGDRLVNGAHSPVILAGERVEARLIRL